VTLGRKAGRTLLAYADVCDVVRVEALSTPLVGVNISFHLSPARRREGASQSLQSVLVCDQES